MSSNRMTRLPLGFPKGQRQCIEKSEPFTIPVACNTQHGHLEKTPQIQRR